jgi:hypothetical protein
MGKFLLIRDVSSTSAPTIAWSQMATSIKPLTQRHQNRATIFWWIVFIACVSAVINNLATIGSWFGIQSKWFYSQQYEIPEANITITGKPPDCDWGFAPLGNKGCHYEIEIYSERWERHNGNSGFVILRTKDERTGKEQIRRYEQGDPAFGALDIKNTLYVGWEKKTP